MPPTHQQTSAAAISKPIRKPVPPIPFTTDVGEMVEYFFDNAIEPTPEELGTALVRVGRNNGPALIAGLHCEWRLTPAAATAHVGGAWSAVAFPEDCLDRETWVELFGDAGYTVDRVPAPRPTEPLRLYRGAPVSRRDRMSWTDDLATARRFASGEMWGTEPDTVWTALVEPSRLLCANLDGRGEREYIIDTDGLAIEQLDGA
jgi:hypothetical protein